MRQNGGLIGKYNGPSGKFANGIVNLSVHYAAKTEGRWPESSVYPTWLTSAIGLSDNNAKRVVANTTSVFGLTMANNDMSFYYCVSASNSVVQYNMSEASNIETATIVSSRNVITLTGLSTFSPVGVEFSPDGTKMAVTSLIRDNVYSFSLSTAWDISTATYDNYWINVTTQEATPYAVEFGNSGFSMYVLGPSSDQIHQYNMTQAYNVATATYTSRSFSVVTQDGTPYDFDFSSDGTQFIMIGDSNDTIWHYKLNTAWNIQTSYYTSTSFRPLGNTSNQVISGHTSSGVSYNSNGSKFIMIDGGSGTIFQFKTRSAYNIGTPWIATAVTLANSLYLPTSTELSFRGLRVSPDGKKVFITSLNNDCIIEYNLNVSGNVFGGNTGSYVFPADLLVNASFTPADLAFKPDGSKLFLLDTAQPWVVEYNLPRAWELSDITWSKTHSGRVPASSASIEFSLDGSYLYTIRSTGVITQHIMSEAWNVASITSNTNYAVGANTKATGIGASYTCIRFSNNGKYMYLTGPTNGWIDRYELATPWDITTAGTVRDTIYTEGLDTTTQAFEFSRDGTLLYLLGDTNDRLFQYEILPF